MITWNEKAKRLLKSELVKRGITNADLVLLLNEAGLAETKASVDSKISRGTFSAAFFLHCLSVMKCSKIELENSESYLSLAAESTEEYYYVKK